MRKLLIFASIVFSVNSLIALHVFAETVSNPCPPPLLGRDDIDLKKIEGGQEAGVREQSVNNVVVVKTAEVQEAASITCPGNASGKPCPPPTFQEEEYKIPNEIQKSASRKDGSNLSSGIGDQELALEVAIISCPDK